MKCFLFLLITNFPLVVKCSILTDVVVTRARDSDESSTEPNAEHSRMQSRVECKAETKGQFIVDADANGTQTERKRRNVKNIANQLYDS